MFREHGLHEIPNGWGGKKANKQGRVAKNRGQSLCPGNQGKEGDSDKAFYPSLVADVDQVAGH